MTQSDIAALESASRVAMAWTPEGYDRRAPLRTILGALIAGVGILIAAAAMLFAAA